MKTDLLLVAAFVSAVLSVSCDETNSQMTAKTGEGIKTVASGLDTPWEILWGPDDRIWFTQRKGTVSRLDPQTGETVTLLTISDVYEEGESGLLGMALHPEFNANPFVYLAYTYYSGGIKERIVRYSYNGRELADPMILLDNIAGAQIHDGARLLIDGGKLFISTGETGNSALAQDLSSLNGKILRMNLDGSVPADNPYAGSYVWSYGHRNAQGMVITGGKLYISEHGPNSDDEVNLVLRGRNYGWPQVYGYCDSPSEKDFCTGNKVVEPLQAWTPTLAVAGLDYYSHDKIPEWQNSLLLTTLKAGELLSMKLGDNGESVAEPEVWFKGSFGRIRDLCVSPDGTVYIATSNRDGRGSPSNDDDRIISISSVK